MKIPQYPNDFIFYPNNFGIRATDEEINIMIQEAINILEQDKNKWSTWRGLGKTKVYVFRYYYKPDCDEYYYNIEITHNYASNDTTDNETMDRVFKNEILE